MSKKTVPPAVPLSSNDINQPPSTSVFAMLLRAYWLFLGHFGIVMSGAMIFLGNLQPKILAHCIYFAAVMLPIAVRYIDIRFYKGQTGECEPATMAHWRKYSLLIAAYTLPLWVIVSLIARSKAGL